MLVICEKPAQARDMARHLGATQKHSGYLEGNGYQVTWCVGHLLELAPPQAYRADISPWHLEKLPVVPNTWKLFIKPKTKTQFKVVQQLLKQTNQVLIASDFDREGECLVREILEYCHYQGEIKRLCLTALDDQSIQKALNTIQDGKVTEPLYFAAHARALSDWLLGLNLTMAVSSLYGVNSVLSIGRVQTPTLKLVVERDRAIEAFTPQPYFVLKALFSDQQNQRFWATWQAPESVVDEQGHCLTKTTVENMAAKIEGEPGVIKQFNEVQKHQKAPLCFSLSSLQKKTSSRWGYSAKHTLDIAQSLYETHKAITYPRSDCPYLPEEQWAEAKTILNALMQVDFNLKTIINECDPHVKSTVWNTKKITAHHAIIPTLNSCIDIKNMSEAEFNVYDLIRRHYIAQFLGDYGYCQQTIEVMCAGEVLSAIGHVPIHLGWKKIIDRLKKTESVILPSLAEGMSVNNDDVTIEDQHTQPPPRFTEGTLIEAMKHVGQCLEDESLKTVLKNSQGIGTEATRANILEVLVRRHYVKRHGKQLISTDKGRALLTVLPKSIQDPVLTAQWEQKLNAMEHSPASGKNSVNEFVAAQVTLLHTMLAQLKQQADQAENHDSETQDKQNKQDKRDKKTQYAQLQLQSDTQTGQVYLCPHCQAPLRRLKNKKKNYFWGCSQYPTCRVTVNDAQGKPKI